MKSLNKGLGQEKLFKRALPTSRSSPKVLQLPHN